MLEERHWGSRGLSSWNPSRLAFWFMLPFYRPCLCCWVSLFSCLLVHLASFGGSWWVSCCWFPVYPLSSLLHLLELLSAFTECLVMGFIVVFVFRVPRSSVVRLSPAGLPLPLFWLGSAVDFSWCFLLAPLVVGPCRRSTFCLQLVPLHACTLWVGFVET